jgi:hypothetical protein
MLVSNASALRRVVLDVALGVLLIGMVVALGIAFAAPWLPADAPGGADLARYAPLRDGAARLEVKEGPDGQPVAWDGVNVVLVSSARASGIDLRKPQRDAVEMFLRRPGEASLSEVELARRLADVQVVEQQRRSLNAGGQVSTNVTLTLREVRGDFLVGDYDPASDSDLLFDPPLQMLPASLAVGQTWGAEGRVGPARYTWSGRVVAAGPAESRLGRFDDCVEIETRLVATCSRATTESMYRDRLCAGVGIVESQELDGTGVLRSSGLLVGTDRQPGDASAMPAPQVMSARGRAAASNAADPAGWRMSRLGRFGRCRRRREHDPADLRPR